MATTDDKVGMNISSTIAGLLSNFYLSERDYHFYHATMTPAE